MELPNFGLGLYRMPAADVIDTVDLALALGYRLFDTASSYRNEEALGQALRLLLPKHGLHRDQVFITSKLAPADHGYEEAKAAVKKSVDRLGLGPIDLYLVHWPGKGGLPPASPEHANWRRATWRALEECLEAGLIRSIGVSNYTCKHLAEMQAYARVMPAVNQIELHPLYQPMDVIELCRLLGIRIQAYSSLAQGRLLEMELPVDMAGRSPAQVCLAWALQHGYGVIPKSVNFYRLSENIGCWRVSLSDEEMSRIDAMKDLPGAGKICWDPETVA